MRLAIELRGTPPDASMVGDVLRTIGATPRKESGPETVVEREFAFESSISNNAFIASWIHRALPVLRTLHERHPIARVTVSAR